MLLKLNSCQLSHQEEREKFLVGEESWSGCEHPSDILRLLVLFNNTELITGRWLSWSR